MQQTGGHESSVERRKSLAHRRMSNEEHPSPVSVEFQEALEKDGFTFAGELSNPILGEDTEDEDPRAPGSTNKPPSASSIPGKVLPSQEGARKIRGWLEELLEQHGVTADEQQWQRDLDAFMDEIHPLYAFLHPSSVRETFNDLWNYSPFWFLTDPAQREQKQTSVAIVFFCLALGRCSAFSRMTDSSGVYSSGWSLYSVGTSLFKDTTQMSSATTDTDTLQALVLRVSQGCPLI